MLVQILLQLIKTLIAQLNQQNPYSDSTQSPPGAQGIIQPSEAVQQYLDKNYAAGAELFDVDGDGLISKGDRIVYDNGSGFQQVVTIDQALAQTLNSL